MQIKDAVLLIKGEQTQVPLKRVAVEAEVLDLACSTTIKHTYQNTEKKAVEAVYCFPVEEGAAVYDFEIETDGKTLKGIVEVATVLKRRFWIQRKFEKHLIRQGTFTFSICLDYITPMMAAGKTDHIWTVEELLSFNI